MDVLEAMAAAVSDWFDSTARVAAPTVGVTVMPAAVRDWAGALPVDRLAAPTVGVTVIEAATRSRDDTATVAAPAVGVTVIPAAVRD